MLPGTLQCYTQQEEGWVLGSFCKDRQVFYLFIYFCYLLLTPVWSTWLARKKGWLHISVRRESVASKCPGEILRPLSETRRQHREVLQIWCTEQHFSTNCGGGNFTSLGISCPPKHVYHYQCHSCSHYPPFTHCMDLSPGRPLFAGFHISKDRDNLHPC